MYAMTAKQNKAQTRTKDLKKKTKKSDVNRMKIGCDKRILHRLGRPASLRKICSKSFGHWSNYLIMFGCFSSWPNNSISRHNEANRTHTQSSHTFSKTFFFFSSVEFRHCFCLAFVLMRLVLFCRFYLPGELRMINIIQIMIF